jgi:EAL domain-containing protein (putative c-di-GMP-specific phosphodiesterase class I)
MICSSHAIRQLQKWQQQFAARGAFSMCINLSSKQFYQCDLPEQVEGLLRETGADGRGLTLEITEGVVVDNSPSALALLGRLKSLGAQVYLDDFGTGYSSLGYLHRLPLDALKIDRSFVGRMDTETKHRQLVQTILMLAQGVGIGTVAEGIETREQLDALRSMGCDFGQGYLFSRPLEPDAFEALLHEDPQW